MGYQEFSDWRSAVFSGNYTIYFNDSRIFERLGPYLELETKWNFNGVNKFQNAKLGMSTTMRGQLGVNTSIQRSRETFRDIEFDDIWNFSVGGSRSLSEELYVSASLNLGQHISRSHLLTGKQTAVNLYAYIRPHDRLQIEPNYNYIISKNPDDNSILFEGYILWLRTYFHFNRNFNIRLITQYNHIYESLNIDPMITYRINPFSVFYLGSTYEYFNATGTEQGFEDGGTFLNRRQFFAKLQYLFRL